MKFTHALATLAVLAGFGAGATTAFAQATRTWVSGTGDDANPCSRTAPCKTFAGAISKTVVAGEINCLDPGGFGALTITKAISIICSAGEAGVLVSGTDGIVVNAGPADSVHLEGLDFEGLGTGLSGVNIRQAGLVRIVHSTIRGFTTAGIYVEPSAASGKVEVDVVASVIADNAGTGVLGKPSGGSSVNMLIDATTISQNNGDGVMANARLTTGTLSVAVRNSAAVHNGGDGFVAFSQGQAAQMLVDTSSASDNLVGIVANGAGATIRFARSDVTGNATGVLQVGAAAALSYGNNSVNGNNTDGSFGTVAQQ